MTAPDITGSTRLPLLRLLVFGFQDFDFSLVRNFIFRERFRLQFRAESFNILNHPNLGLPNSSIGNAAVGSITTTINAERQNQLALKLYF
jgi:hypothetical protein